MHPYTEWECYQNGMYDTSYSEAIVIKSVQLLSDSQMLKAQMQRVLSEWVKSATTHLSDNSSKRSYLGWAACCISHGSNDICTREAWGRLKENEKRLANMAADFVISQYELNKTKANVQTEIRF